jgi:2-hydroxy-3-oxopropionate reductase
MPVSHSSPRVGFIGLGVMGRGMAACLLKHGHALTVHNRTRAAEAPLLALGATAADSPAQVGANAEVVFLCLSDTQAVHDVLFGENGLARALAPGSHIIDTSTISAQAARQHAERLDDLGIALLDAPVSGGQQGAQTGQLTCMVGGPQAAFDTCRPFLDAIATRVRRIGDHGAGQVTKACNQVAVSAVMMGVAEAFALARSNGVDPAVVREVLLEGTARSNILEKNALRMLSGDYEPGFKTELMRKDLRLAVACGQAAGAVMPMASVIATFLQAACNAGYSGLDWSALGRLMAELSEGPENRAPGR